MSIPVQTAQTGQQFLTRNGMTSAHPPYSQDLTPGNFFVCLFHWKIKVFKGKHFADVKEVKQTKKMAEALKGIKINELKTALSSGKNILIVYFEGD